MFDFDTLEKKCKIYHFKKYLFLSLPIIGILAIATYIFLYYNNTIQEEKTGVEKKQLAVQQAAVKKTVSLKKERPKVVKQVKAKVLKKSPKIAKMKKDNKCYSLQFYVATKPNRAYIQNKQKQLLNLGFDCFIYEGDKNWLYLRCNRTQDYNEYLSSKKLARKYHLEFMTKRMECSHKTAKKVHKKNIVQKPKTVVKPVEPIQESIFVLQSKTFDLKKLKKLFQERKSYNIALKIARYYYEAKDYPKAIEWSKRANSIDNSDDESWILYAKSLYANKEYEKAKKILEIYTQFESSSKVTKLLSDWSNK